MVELDALRGLAALQSSPSTTRRIITTKSATPSRWASVFPAGNYGVQLFFLISGFVIFMTLERTRTAMDFVVSRFSRLFPAYWAAMAITAAVVYSIGLPSQKLPLHDFLLDLTMVQEILGAEHLDGSYWTLAGRTVLLRADAVLVHARPTRRGSARSSAHGCCWRSPTACARRTACIFPGWRARC